MPLYDLICHECDMESEHFMGLDDGSVLIKCPGCGAKMTRHKNKNYAGMRLQIVGDTCAGNNGLWNYYDPILKKQITSKRQRADEMKRQGLQEWAPEASTAKEMNERAYVRANSRPGDKEAARELDKLGKAAREKRRKDAVDRAFAKVNVNDA